MVKSSSLIADIAYVGIIFVYSSLVAYPLAISVLLGVNSTFLKGEAPKQLSKAKIRDNNIELQ